MRKLVPALLLFILAGLAAAAQPVELKLRVTTQDTATRKRDDYFQMPFMFGFSVNQVAGIYYLNATTNLDRRAWNAAGTGMWDLVFPKSGWCSTCNPPPEPCDPMLKPAQWDSRCGDAVGVMWKAVTSTVPRWNYLDVRSNTTAFVNPTPTTTTWPYQWPGQFMQTGIPGFDAAINFAKINAAIPNMVQPAGTPADCRRELWNTDFDATGASNAKAAYVNGKWYMAFTGTVMNPTVTGDWTADEIFNVYWAISSDGKNWTVRRPLFRTTLETTQCGGGLLMTQLFTDSGYFYIVLKEMRGTMHGSSLLRAPIDASTDGFTSWQIAARDPLNANRYLWKPVPANGYLDYATLDAFPVMSYGGSVSSVKQTVISRVFASSSPFSPSMFVGVATRYSGDASKIDVWTAPDLDTPFTYQSEIDVAYIPPKGTWGYEPQFTVYSDNTPSTPAVVGRELDFWLTGDMNVGTSVFWKNLVAYRATGTLSGGIFSPRGSFRSWNSHYISAVNGGDAAVNADPTAFAANERFVLIDVNGGSLVSGDSVYLQSRSGKFLSAVSGGGTNLTANQTGTGTFETFTILKQNGTGTIVNGDSVAFRSSGGYYVVAEPTGTGGTPLNCNRTAVGPWETFVFVAN